jgi:hypothetical protein
MYLPHGNHFPQIPVESHQQASRTNSRKSGANTTRSNKIYLKKHPIMVQKHVDFVNTSIRTTHHPGIHNIASPEQDLTIPDLRNVLITHTVILNGISATALIDSGAQEDFVDTNFVLAYNMATTTTLHKRYVSLANGARQDASATLMDATMVITT